MKTLSEPFGSDLISQLFILCTDPGIKYDKYNYLCRYFLHSPILTTDIPMFSTHILSIRTGNGTAIMAA